VWVAALTVHRPANVLWTASALEKDREGGRDEQTDGQRETEQRTEEEQRHHVSLTRVKTNCYFHT